MITSFPPFATMTLRQIQTNHTRVWVAGFILSWCISDTKMFNITSWLLSSGATLTHGSYGTIHSFDLMDTSCLIVPFKMSGGSFWHHTKSQYLMERFGSWMLVVAERGRCQGRFPMRLLWTWPEICLRTRFSWTYLRVAFVRWKSPFVSEFIHRLVVLASRRSISCCTMLCTDATYVPR